MKSGYKKTYYSRKDYDLFKTKGVKFGAILPDSYSVYKGLRIPNQQVPDGNFTPPVPALPYGCTSYAQCELCGNEDGVLYNPLYIESFTHSNTSGGADVRTVLDVVVKNGVQDASGNINKNHPAYFAIRSAGKIDAFDAARLAMLSTSTENRGVSVGSPYWLQFRAVGPNGILPSPDYNLQYASWHNWIIEGWKTIDGVPYLICQMLQGDSYGDKGFVYMSREIFNATTAVPGSVMFTIDKLMPGETIQTVDMNIVEMIVNFIRNLFSL